MLLLLRNRGKTNDDRIGHGELRVPFRAPEGTGLKYGRMFEAFIFDLEDFLELEQNIGLLE